LTMVRRLISPKNIQAQQYQPPDDPPSVPIKVLNSTISDPGNANQAQRNIFGAGISMEGIYSALLQANKGSMRQLTDLSRETVDTDPHLASILQKRFGAVSTLPWEVRPAEGFGVDKERAMFYATLVREQLNNLQNFQQVINQLAWGLFDGRAALEHKWGNVVAPVKSPFGAMTLVLLAIEWIHPRRINFGPSREMRITDETRGISSGSFSEEGLSLDDEDLKDNRLWRKFISWTPQLFGEYPEREGLARRCLYWSFFKRFAARDMMILLELFGKPWRILEVSEDSTASNEDLLAGEEAIEALGAAYSARIPRGTTANVIQPGRTAGQVHQEVVEESDKQLSKLVLGQTGTTDGVPAGLNSNQASVMQDEQFMILVRDARALSQIIESQITDAIIELNFGPESLPMAPKFVLRSDIPADRKAELERLDAALKTGMEIARQEAYELSGFRLPEEDEPIIRIDQPSPLSPILPPPQPRPVIVYPKGESPETGEQQPPATIASEDEGSDDSQKAQIGAADINKIVTVNEARAAEGLPPLTLPDGSPDPDGDLTVVEFAARSVGNQAGNVQEPEPEVEPEVPEIEEDEDEEEDELEAIEAAKRSVVMTKLSSQSEYADIAEPLLLHILSRDADIARMKAMTRGSCKYCLQIDEHKQPETPFGSPEQILSAESGFRRP
jgi:phage gp29-like protein